MGGRKSGDVKGVGAVLMKLPRVKEWKGAT